MRRLCIGDIHGCYDKLLETLEVCKFSDSDILYSVGVAILPKIFKFLIKF